MSNLLPTARVLGLAILAGWLPACGGEPERSSPASNDTDRPVADTTDGSQATRASTGRRSGSSTPDAESLGREDYDSADLGALYGEIRFTGEAPERFPLGASQKSECTHHPEVDHMSDTAIVNDGKVQYVYVYIRSGFSETVIPPPADEPVILDQRGCVYVPHVQALQAGQQLQVRNSDPTNHNVNYKAPRNNKSGNRNMGQGQDPLEIDFEREETKVRFKCDIHPWMESWVHVCEHPWFAVTDEAGTFRIPDVPPGDYVIEAIHEVFGKLRGKVTVAAGQATGFALTFE